MANAEKPRHRSGYTREEARQVEATCLTVAVTLGALMDDLCIVGGLVPSLIIDRGLGPDLATGELHPGTNDQGGRVQPLEADFGALIAPGLKLAFDERHLVELDGHTLAGEEVRRMIPVCGPATFAVLKALAFADRGEPKDAYDLVYVLRRWAGGVSEIADRLTRHAERYPDVVSNALEALARDFEEPGRIGPRRTASFDFGSEDVDAAAADAHGHVDDSLRACRARGLSAS